MQTIFYMGQSHVYHCNQNLSHLSAGVTKKTDYLPSQLG